MSWGTGEERKLERLLFKEGFRIIFLESNDSNYRDEIIASIGEKYPPSLRLDVNEFPGFNEFTALLPAIAEKNRTIQLVGIEKWFLSGKASAYGFNLNREYFRENCPAALFFWLDAETIRDFAINAPDFWAFRSVILDGKRPFEPEQLLETSFTPDETYRPERIEELEKYLRENEPQAALEAMLREELGELLTTAARFDEAREAYERALALFGQTGDWLRHFVLYKKLGDLQQRISGREAARKVFAEALRTSEQWLAKQGTPHNLEAAQIMHLRSVFYFESGEREKSLHCAEQALAVRESILPPDHIEIGLSHRSMARIFLKMGDLEHALERSLKALEISEKRLGPEDIHTAMRYGELAGVLRQRGELREALDSAEKACAILEKIETERWAIVFIYGTLTGIHLDMGQLDRALEFAEKTDELLRMTRPPKHPDVAANYMNLALIHNYKGDREQALKFANQAREILESVFPPQHERFAEVYGTLSAIYQGRNQFDQALDFREKAIAIFEKQLPPNHPAFVKNYHNLATIIASDEQNPKRDFAKAKHYAERALAVLQNASTPKESELFLIYNTLSNISLKNGDAKLALQYAEKNQSLLKNIPCLHPPHLILHHNTLGAILNALNRNEEAIEQLQKAVALAEKEFPEGHPTLQLQRDNLTQAQADKHN